MESSRSGMVMADARVLLLARDGGIQCGELWKVGVLR